MCYYLIDNQYVMVRQLCDTAQNRTILSQK